MPYLVHTPKDDDETLLAHFLRGDESAFDALVLRFSPRLYPVALRILNDAGEAEDVLQEMWIALHTSLRDFRGESKLSTWLYRVVHNRCLNRLKFLQRRHVGQQHDIDDPALTASLADPRTQAQGEFDPQRKMSREQQRQYIEAALQKLPEEQRTLIVLRDLEEMSYDDIAAISGLAMGTIKSRLHRGRIALANLLSPYLDEMDG